MSVYLTMCLMREIGKPITVVCVCISRVFFSPIFFCLIRLSLLCLLSPFTQSQLYLIYTRSGNNDDAIPPPILVKWVLRLLLCQAFGTHFTIWFENFTLLFSTMYSVFLSFYIILMCNCANRVMMLARALRFQNAAS